MFNLCEVEVEYFTETLNGVAVVFFGCVMGKPMFLYCEDVVQNQSGPSAGRPVTRFYCQLVVGVSY